MAPGFLLGGGRVASTRIRSTPHYDLTTAFTVTRNGVPVGELFPLRRDRFVGAAAAMAAFRGAPRVDFDRLRADSDAVANQDLTPRG